jgi:hypothetical protein
MRYSGYRKRVDALLEKLQPRGSVIRIVGGLPDPPPEGEAKPEPAPGPAPGPKA